MIPYQTYRARIEAILRGIAKIFHMSLYSLLDTFRGKHSYLAKAVLDIYHKQYDVEPNPVSLSVVTHMLSSMLAEIEADISGEVSLDELQEWLESNLYEG